MTDSGKEAIRPPASGSGASGRSAKRVVAVASSIVVLGVLAVAALRFVLPGDESARNAVPGGKAARGKPGPLLPEVESRIFQVTEATGRVEAQRGGQWVLIAAGDVLTQDDLVRTGNGRAILKLGRTTEIELRDRVELRLDSISRAGASVDLRRGRVVAHVGRSGSNVAITAARTRTANEGGSPARFVVTADELGRVAVATTEGAASFEAAGRVVNVPAGSATRADPGQPPTDPERIPEEVFLSVTWPTGDRRDDKVPVTGRAAPGSVVRVNGADTDIDGSGQFTASVPLKVGPNPIRVDVEDPSGRSRSERRDIRKISTKGPDLAPVPTDLWKK